MLLGQGEAEQAHLGGRPAQALRNRVGALDLVLAGHHLVAHEPAHRGQRGLELLGIHRSPHFCGAAVAEISARAPNRDMSTVPRAKPITGTIEPKPVSRAWPIIGVVPPSNVPARA